MDRVVVSRHPAAIAFIARQLDGEFRTPTVSDRWPECVAVRCGDGLDYIPVVAHATADR